MNAIPVLRPISIGVVQRPQFDNAHLGIPRQWMKDNAETLARYYKAQTEALPPDEKVNDSDDDFDFWLRVQHDIELRKASRIPHGGTL